MHLFNITIKTNLTCLNISGEIGQRFHVNLRIFQSLAKPIIKHCMKLLISFLEAPFNFLKSSPEWKSQIHLPMSQA